MIELGADPAVAGGVGTAVLLGMAVRTVSLIRVPEVVAEGRSVLGSSITRSASPNSWSAFTQEPIAGSFVTESFLYSPCLEDPR